MQRRDRRSWVDLARRAKAGAWWKDRTTPDSEPRQIDRVESGGPLGGRVYFTAGKSMTVRNLLHSFDPCAAPEVAPQPKPNGHDVAPSGGLRLIVREEITAALAVFAAELRPAIREEALAAVQAAFEVHQ
jgi:hypothetical protein